ncbi:MAG: winged helix-turn-helix domain-containing protein [Anaerolineae bacterium]
MLELTTAQVRQLSVFAQRLGEKTPPSSKERMFDVLQSIRCLQLDPIRAVERTQFTVLWSRLGEYDRQWLNELTYSDKKLFEFWAHAASIVLFEDYPIHRYFMDRYGTDPKKKITKWIEQNQAFKNYVLAEIDRLGERLTNQFEDRADVGWGSSGWTNDRSLPYMLDYLWTRGEIMVSNRDGLKRWWDMAHRVRPESTDTTTILSPEAATYKSAELSLKALGIGRMRDIKVHFTRGRYPHLKTAVPQLVADGTFIEASVPELGTDTWYVHRDFVSFFDNPEHAGWQPRTTLLSPFDNLICDRDRTELIWNFYYRIEIYVPAVKRQYGYYVLPILHGDRLIGRIDSRMDRKAGVYNVNAVFAQSDAPMSEDVGQAVQQAILDFGRFLGAKKVKYGRKKPAGWRSSLKTQKIN